MLFSPKYQLLSLVLALGVNWEIVWRKLGNHAAAERLPGAAGPRDRLSAAGRNALAKPVWSSREGRN